jgi:hypothetical protein
MSSFVVPSWVVEAVNSLSWNEGNIVTTYDNYCDYKISRLFTKTSDESGDGIFEKGRKIEFYREDKIVIVDFLNLPLDEKNWESNLLERIRLVGQAFEDLPPPAPHEGLIPMEEIVQEVERLIWKDGDIVSCLGQVHSHTSSRTLTGTEEESNTRGVFDVDAGYCYFRESGGKKFEVKFDLPLTPDNFKTEIPNRIRLVREARVKA